MHVTWSRPTFLPCTYRSSVKVVTAPSPLPAVLKDVDVAVAVSVVGFVEVRPLAPTAIAMVAALAAAVSASRRFMLGPPCWVLAWVVRRMVLRGRRFRIRSPFLIFCPAGSRLVSGGRAGRQRRPDPGSITSVAL